MKSFSKHFLLFVLLLLNSSGSFSQVDSEVKSIIGEMRQAFKAANYSKSLLLLDKVFLLDSSFASKKKAIETKILLLIKNEAFEDVYPQVENSLERCYYSINELKSFKQTFLDKKSPFHPYAQTPFWEKSGQLIDSAIQVKNAFLEKIRGDLSFFEEAPLKNHIDSYYSEGELSEKGLNQVDGYEFTSQRRFKNDTVIQLYHLPFKQDSIPFLVYVSPQFDQANEDNKTYIYMHGGANNMKDYMIDEQVLNEPIFKKASRESSIVIYPLGKRDKGWKDDHVLLSIHKMYNLVSLRYNIRPKNTYVIGHSNGGRAVFWLAINAPGKWKHFLSIAPSYDEGLAKSSLLISNLENVHFASIHVEADASSNRFYDSVYSSSKIKNWNYQQLNKKHGFIYDDTELEFFCEIVDRLKDGKQRKTEKKNYCLHPEIPSLQSCFFYSPSSELKSGETPILSLTKKDDRIDVEPVDNPNFESEVKLTFFSRNRLNAYGNKVEEKCVSSELNAFPWDCLDIDIGNLETKSSEVVYVSK